MFEVPEMEENYSLLTKIVLWRIFNFCLYSDYATIVLGYMIRKFKKIFPKIEKKQNDYVYSLFCYLYVMDGRKNTEKSGRYQETKEGVVHLLEEFLTNLDLKVFCKKNFFLRLDYDHDQIRNNLAHIIKVNNDVNTVFEMISEELLNSKNFSDKSLLLIAFAKKTLLK